jgi:ABC-2 type transport system ATP-binding protein
MNENLAIEASGLAKSYRDVPVLAGVDLNIPRGSVFALLGPNGAGKTTTVRILATLTEADAGRARVAGFDVRHDRSQVRRRISLTGQFAALDEAQTGEENLRMMGRLARLSRAEAAARAAELIGQFGLTGAARPGEHLLRRDAPPPRHRRQPGRPPVGHLPRRAVDRA